MVAISCGAYHSTALTESGRVFNWGQNSKNQLGDGLTGHRYLPSKVNFMDGVIIKKIVCGYYHSLVLSNKGEIDTFGYNSSGQLGNGNQYKSSTPLKINICTKLIAISIGFINNI